MDNAGLHDRLLPHGAHRVGQALQPVADQHAHVPHAAVLDLGQDPQPVLRSLAVAVLPGPQAQHVPLAVHGDAQRQVDGPVRDLALADLHVNSVDEDHRVDRVERPALPFGHALHDPVGDRGDRLLGDLRAVDLGQVRGDLPVRQPFRGQGNHHLIDPGQPPLPLGDDFRLETGVPVPRHGDLHRPGLGEHRLGPVAIAGIAAIAARRDRACHSRDGHPARPPARPRPPSWSACPAARPHRSAAARPPGPARSAPAAPAHPPPTAPPALALARSSRQSLVSPPSQELHR